MASTREKRVMAGRITAWLQRLGFVFAACLACAQNETVTVRPTPIPGQAEVSIGSQTNKFYQMEMSGDLKHWVSILAANGTGSNLAYRVDAGAHERLFFRFVIEENGALRGLTNLPLSESGGFGEAAQATALLLSSNGVLTTDELFNRFRSVSRLNYEVKRLQQAGVGIDGGNIIGLLKEAELRTNLKPLEDLGFRKSLTDSLAKSRLNMTDLHRFMRRIPADAGELQTREAYLEFKNTLSEVNDVKPSRAEFLQLRNYVSALTPTPDLRITQSFQDVPYGSLPGLSKNLSAKTSVASGVVTTTNEPASVAEEKLVKQSPPDYSYIPRLAQRQSQARLMHQPFPLTILGWRVDRTGPIPLPVAVAAHPPFTEESENAGYRKFVINESGLAWFKAYGHASGARLLIRNPSGQVILDDHIPANTTRGFLLPIFKEDVCASFEALKDDGLTLSIVALQRPLVVENSADEFKLQDQALAAVLPSQPAGAAWLRFSLLQASNAGAQPSVALVQARNTLQQDDVYHLSLLNPERSTITNTMPLNQTVEMPVSGRNGLWDLLVMPSGIKGLPLVTFHPESGKVSGLSLFALNLTNDCGEPVIDFSLRHAPVQTRAFVLGKLNKVAYSRDGESLGTFGEVKLSLHANIAPYFSQSANFASVFGGSRSFQAWQLWMDAGKRSAALANHELFQAGVAEIRADEAFLAEYQSLFFGFMQNNNSSYSFSDNDDLLAIYSIYIKDKLGKSWYRNIEDANAIYRSWSDNVVQINAFKYPFGQKYKIVDNLISGNPFDGAPFVLNLHPVIPTDIPVFAAPKDRMAQETLPVSFDYASWEEDELDKSDLVGSALKGVVNIGLGIIGNNWARAICSGVDMIDEMHKTVEAAKDDPIGTANFRLSRASSRHGFYGLEDDSILSFNFSGKPRKNGVNAFETGLSYAKLTCDTLSSVSSIGGQVDSLKRNLSSAWDMLSSGNLSDLDGLKSILILAAGNNGDKIERIEQFISRLRSGELSDDFETVLEMAALSESLTEGTDLYDTFTGLTENLKAMSGMGSLGFNLAHSECYFHFNGYDDRKTTANSSVGIVRSVPGRSIAVTLDKVNVFDIKEEGLSLPAEIFVNSRVGVIADQPPADWKNVPLQFADENNQLVLNNGGKGFVSCPNVPYAAYAKRTFPIASFMAPDVYAPWSKVNNTLLDARWNSGMNAAAIYVELGIYENDGDNIDDDMIGVYSRTFLLEDILKSPGIEWTQTDATHWRLNVTDYPVYDAANLETIVEVQEGEMKARQLAHNRERLAHPSAQVSFHIEIEMGDLVQWTDTNSYNLQAGAVSQSLSNIHLRVAACGQDFAEQIMDAQAGWALARLQTDPQEIVLGVYQVNPTNTAGPLIQKHCQLPAKDMGAEVKNWFDHSRFLWAQFARKGAFVVVAHSEGIASFDVRNPSDIKMTNCPLPSASFPSRLAVDADGERIFVSFRKTGKDLAVFQLTEDGALKLILEKDDINHTIAGLIPLPGGGVIVHSISGIRNDSDGYALFEGGADESYFAKTDNLLDEGGDRFGNYNALMTLVWNEGGLVPHSFIDLSGALSEAQMLRVRLRRQSSMFQLFDEHTLLSRGRQPFAIGLDTRLFFTNPEWLNKKDAEFNKYWVTDLLGLNVGPCYIGSKINRRINKTFARAYDANEAALSPFNAYTANEGPLTCPDNVLVGDDLFPAGIMGGAPCLLARGITNDYKSVAYSSLETSAPLILVSLKEPTHIPELAPAFSGQSDIGAGQYVDCFTFLSNASLAIVGGHDTMDGGNDLHLVDFSNPDLPVTILDFGGDLFSTADVLYVQSRQLLFVANARSATVDVYRLTNPSNPQKITALNISASALAWSEKRKQLYVTGIYGAITVCSLTDAGSFEFYQERLNGVGYFKRLVLNDDLDVAFASAEPFAFMNVGANELLVLDFSEAGDTNRSTGRISIKGRWMYPETGYYVSIRDVALSPDAKTGYAVIRNKNQYMDLYRFNLSDHANPTPSKAAYNSVSMAPLIGGIALSHDGRYLICTRNGIDVFDTQDKSNLGFAPITHLDGSDMSYAYGPVEFSPDGAFILTGRTAYPNHVLRVKLFK